MLFGGDTPGNPGNSGEDSPAGATSDPEAQQPAGKTPITVDEIPATEEAASNLLSSNSGVGGIGIPLALISLSAAGLVVFHQIRSKLNPTIPSEPGIGGNSTSNEVIERATGASADAVESFSSARTATKAAGATSGGGNNVPGETASEAQPTDTSSDPVLAAWIPGKHIRLLIADDEPVVRSNLRDMLESQSDFEVVGEAATGVEAVELADRLHPRVVLTDLHMPEMDGVAASARIRSRHSDTYTLVTTYEDGDADIARAIEAGATGYLLKDAPREEVFEIIRATAQGKTTNQ